jgi:hypothetical protein
VACRAGDGVEQCVGGGIDRHGPHLHRWMVGLAPGTV